MLKNTDFKNRGNFRYALVGALLVSCTSCELLKDSFDSRDMQAPTSLSTPGAISKMGQVEKTAQSTAQSAVPTSINQVRGISRQRAFWARRLLAQTKSKDSALRARASTRLGKLGVVHPEIIRTLSVLSQSDSSPWVRRNSLKSLEKLSLSDALALSVKLQADRDPWVRHSAKAIVSKNRR